MESSPVSHPRSRWIGYLLRLCHIPVMRLFSHRLTELELNPRQYHLLYLARSNPGGHNQNTLANEIGITPNIAGDLLKDLAERKLVSQLANPGNKRENFITVTPTGLSLLALAESVAAITQAQLLSVLTEPEQEELIRLLQKFAAGLADKRS